jgi:tetratricopeptide (TPR) repeat protein
LIAFFLSIRRIVFFAPFFVALCFSNVVSFASAQTTTQPTDKAQEEDRQAGRVQQTYNEAVELLQQGRAAEAIALVEAAVKAGVHDPSLYNLQGLAASELGRNEEARQCFQEVIRLSPKSALGYNNLGVLLSKQGHYKDAAANFRDAQARDPRNFTALLGLGTSLAALKKYAEAAQYLQKAWDVRPGDFQTGYEWAHALLEAKQAAAANNVLRKVAPPQETALAVKYYSLAGAIADSLHDSAAAEQAYRRAYALDPSYEIYLALVQSAFRGSASSGASDGLPAPPVGLSPAQNQTLGLLFLSHDRYKEAIPPLEQSLRQDETNETTTLNLALAYKGAGEASAAIALIRRTLERSASAALYNTLAELEETSGEYLEAVRNYQKAVELAPTNEDYYFDLGMEYLSHFTFGPALEVYTIGTNKFPDSPRQYLGLAFSHYAVREYAQAADAFTRALEIDPDSPAVLKAWNTVLSSLSPADWGAILPRLSRLAASHPQSADLAFSYGAALFRSEFAKGPKGALEQPQLFLERAIKLRPEFPAARVELAGLYAAKKEDQKAVDEYLEAIKQDPKSDIPHYRLGQIYRQMNKMDLATQQLAQYQELSRLHQEEIKRNRSAIQQFVLSPQAKSN